VFYQKFTKKYLVIVDKINASSFLLLDLLLHLNFLKSAVLE